MPEGLVDRLMLSTGRESRVWQRDSDSLRRLKIRSVKSPGMKKRPNGLLIGQKRVPLGVVGIIYEARPNVTADAFGLCFKTGNVVILKGGSDAIHSNEAIVDCIREISESIWRHGKCDPADCRYFQRDRGRIHENERVCGCADSKRR